MAHLIDMTNNRANMAYVGEKPWHGLGQELTQGAGLDKWRVEAGLNWKAKRSTVQFQTETGLELGESQVLYRSDTYGELGIVSPKYKIVQPGEVLEFFESIVSKGDMHLETAGSLDGGRKVWALAKTHDNFRIMGQDEVNGYLLLSTSFDGSLATRAMFTSVRVVCNNTLQISLQNKGGVSIPHSANFDANRVKMDLGILGEGFADFEEKANLLARRKVSQKEAIQFIFDMLADDVKPENAADLSTRKRNIIENVVTLFNGKAKGSNFASSDKTAWGLVNAITEYVDHEYGHNVNNRFRHAQFGQGATLKSEAFAHALKLVA